MAIVISVHRYLVFMGCPSCSHRWMGYSESRQLHTLKQPVTTYYWRADCRLLCIPLLNKIKIMTSLVVEVQFFGNLFR